MFDALDALQMSSPGGEKCTIPKRLRTPDKGANEVRAIQVSTNHSLRNI